RGDDLHAFGQLDRIREPRQRVLLLEALEHRRATARDSASTRAERIVRRVAARLSCPAEQLGLQAAVVGLLGATVSIGLLLQLALVDLEDLPVAIGRGEIHPLARGLQRERALIEVDEEPVVRSADARLVEPEANGVVDLMY